MCVANVAKHIMYLLFYIVGLSPTRQRREIQEMHSPSTSGQTPIILGKCTY